ncbi:MAG: membrane protein insertase YidC [Anaerolineae bacterium]|jgi:YidC/Oxa1 family membrane protein insertase|nr:MAG: membrane protein insertase YidC [Anaerolineae bacterium]MCL4877820.1 membrane protein insertase YidC [Anaerolineae bacterium]
MLDLLINPFSTMLLLFYSLLGQNVFWAIVAFTVTIRMLILPMTLKQQRSLSAMQEIQPQLKELQEKYKNDRESLAQKQLELYREHGVNPLAGCLPAFIQIPIFLALWRAIIGTLALNPGELLHLYDRILIPGLDHLIPLNGHFLWMNLAVPDPYLVLPVLVVITTWLQQKLLTPPMPKKKNNERSDDPADQAAAMTRQMTTIMPFMLGFFALTYSSGIAVYFVISNIIGIVQQAAMGKADFRRLIGKAPLAEGEESEYFEEESGRHRKPGITIEHLSSAAKKNRPQPVTSLLEPGEKRSQRVNRAMVKAKRAKVSKVRD